MGGGREAGFDSHKHGHPEARLRVREPKPGRPGAAGWARPAGRAGLETAVLCFDSGQSGRRRLRAILPAM